MIGAPSGSAAPTSPRRLGELQSLVPRRQGLARRIIVEVEALLLRRHVLDLLVDTCLGAALHLDAVKPLRLLLHRRSLGLWAAGSTPENAHAPRSPDCTPGSCPS